MFSCECCKIYEISGKHFWTNASAFFKEFDVVVNMNLFRNERNNLYGQNCESPNVLGSFNELFTSLL